jgi:hypothetical protein
MITEIENTLTKGEFKDDSKIEKSMIYKLENALKEYSKLDLEAINQDFAEKALLFDL